MLDSFALLSAMRGIRDEYVTDTANALGYSAESPKTHHINRKLWSTLLVAAIIVSLFTGVAYATNLFGLQALLIRGSKPRENPNADYLSITQPQDVPEEMDAEIREKIDNSAKAWEEWSSWCDENAPHIPESCRLPENCSGIIDEKNEDGTVTMIFLRGIEEIERRVISAEDYAQFEAYLEVRSKDFPGYDPSYHIYTQEMADKLESIAASYELKLRHQITVIYQNYGDREEFSTREEVTAKINEVCAGGSSFFRVEPAGYDKFYYFDEGTFAVSFFITEDQTDSGPICYLYNSPYGTLSSGDEIFDVVEDVSVFTVRSHTTPDGTELTVLQNDTDAYAYVYLKNSFATLHISQVSGLSDAAIDTILDMVDYSTIR